MSEKEKREESFKKYKTEFLKFVSQVSPKTAKILTQKVSFDSVIGTPKEVKGTEPPSVTKQQLSSAIDRYAKAVDETIKGQKRPNFLIDIGIVVVTVILLIVSFVYSNVSGIATTAGVSGVSIVSQAKATSDAFKIYNNDATKLKTSVERLRAMLDLCPDTNSECLKKVQNAIDETFKTLGEASK